MVVGPSRPGQRINVLGADGSAGSVEVDRHRLFTIREGERTQDLLRIEVDEGVEVYTFTFG